MGPRQRRGGRPHSRTASSRTSPSGARIMAAAAAAFPPLPAAAGPAPRRPPAPPVAAGKPRAAAEGLPRAAPCPLLPHRPGGKPAASRPAATAAGGRARQLAPGGPKWRHRPSGSFFLREWVLPGPGVALFSLRAAGGVSFSLLRWSLSGRAPPRKKEAVGWLHSCSLGGLHRVENNNKKTHLRWEVSPGGSLAGGTPAVPRWGAFRPPALPEAWMQN